ncbi:helicase HerA-like domain-containing protein [Ottowia caeni]
MSAQHLLIAKHGEIECAILSSLANRHGLITGATGTGKTVTLQKLAESFSSIGVPVFMSDVKGDLSGISRQGQVGAKMAAILQERGVPLPEPMSLPSDILGCIWRTRPSRSRHHFRHGPTASGPHAGS